LSGGLRRRSAWSRSSKPSGPSFDSGSIIVRLRSEPGFGRLYWGTTNVMLFPVTRVSYVCSCIAFAGCGGVS
jgi:hypothetical protein